MCLICNGDFKMPMHYIYIRIKRRKSNICLTMLLTPNVQWPCLFVFSGISSTFYSKNACLQGSQQDFHKSLSLNKLLCIRQHESWFSCLQGVSDQYKAGCWCVGGWGVKCLNQFVLNLIYKLPRIAGLATTSESNFYNTQFLTNYRH